MLCAAWLATPVIADEAPESGGIDTHVHFYLLEQSSLRDIPNESLAHPHLASDFAPRIAASPISRVVLIEAGTDPAHTAWMLDHARSEPLIAAVIGNLNPADPATAPELARLATDPKFRGIRNRGWGDVDFESPTVRANLGQLEALDLVFESGLRADTVDAIAKIAARHPRLTIVLDHLASGKLDGKGRLPAWWAAAIKRLGAYPSIYVKLSAFDFAARGDSSAERLAPILAPLVANFGPDRLLYGSNWPVSPDNRRMFAILEAAFGSAEPGTLEKILVTNPTRAYRLAPPD